MYVDVLSGDIAEIVILLSAKVTFLASFGRGRSYIVGYFNSFLTLGTGDFSGKP